MTRASPWWAGLTLSKAKAGIAGAGSGLAADAAGGRVLYRAAKGGERPRADAAWAHLLPAFDEYLLGARLHTNSWGGGASAYDSMSMSADRFMWDHKDFLAPFCQRQRWAQ